MAGESAKNMADLIRAVVDDELKKRDQIALCRVRCVNDDGTVDVYDVGDETQSFSKIPNNSGVFLASGDYVYVVKVGGTYSTAYVSRRLATLANIPESPQGQLDNLFAKNKGIDKRLSKLSSYYVKKNNLVDLVYPVGSVYYTTDFEFDPQKAFGGKWKRWSEVSVQGDGITNTGFYENQQKNDPCKIKGVYVEDGNLDEGVVWDKKIPTQVSFEKNTSLPSHLYCSLGDYYKADPPFVGNYLFWFRTSLEKADLINIKVVSFELVTFEIDNEHPRNSHYVSHWRSSLSPIYNGIFPITSMKMPIYIAPGYEPRIDIEFKAGERIDKEWNLSFYMVRWPLAYYRVK